MSSVRIHTPPVKLAKLLRTPGGLPVAEAVQRAGAGLASLKTECLGELKTVLEQAEACAARAGPDYDAALAGELYDIVAKPIGVPSVCGLTAVDTALISLSDLLDYLKGQERWDANAVTVHLRAFRLLLHTEGSADVAGTQAILAGLRKVSQRYAKPE
ncbi:hypothetical protein ASE17_10280 [Phenylobacterium sp. Root77]|uniref:hypothetical protein n=1 Tax=unclassified Phenylobacterium TaxID=2640670 RepID=UPI0007017D7E|nr:MULTISPECIES: hypothetical protein [unclassified Phenylobacterium]KQW73309.1 hypothetical protein ASC73_02850 [Phenylobacterium sp. Root1277]KQW92529.1 hypothetical protein ASC79_13560 [Phenylobacterium sp. Root1290]KRC40758.1 hypothetical protein ASE17_10280 [Phenylobacterium sp. Root77]